MADYAVRFFTTKSEEKTMRRLKQVNRQRKARFESLEGRRLLSANSYKLSPTDAVAEVQSSQLVGDDIGIPRSGRLTKVVSGMVYGGNPDLD